MALFERPTHSHITALLRQGFGARLRSETADIYLAQQADSVTLTNASKRASVFFFCGGEGPLTAILARSPEKGQPRFLSISENVTLTDNPTLLKLTLSNTSRHLFSISRVAPTAYLSLRHVSINSKVNSRPAISKWELFHLEIIPGTIGKGFVDGPLEETHFMKLSQGVSHALLELGVRFRLRSVHDRVLRKINSVIHQDGPKTPVASSHDDELLITAFRSSEDCPDAFCADYALKDIASGQFLNFPPSGVQLTSHQTILRVRASPNGWGSVSIGVKSENGVQWLMAGPRGRLEKRRTPGAWETFAMEFVRQSYDAAIKELPVPGIYKVAETATRENLRQEVEARVAAARKSPVQPRNTKNGNKTFDHSKALAGLSDSRSETRGKAKPQPSGKKKAPGTKAVAGSAGSKTTGAVKGMNTAATAATAAVASSGLPRNKANRKASKRNRKKQKQKSTGGKGYSTKAPPNINQNLQRSTTSSTTKTDSKSQEAGSNAETDLKSDMSSSSSAERVETARGPPCAACGRPILGTHTTALGKSFHPECFCCGRCRRPMGLGAGQFRERGGIPYCTSCYATHLASRCARCSQPIMDTVVTAMEKTWHKDCLTCTICRLPLTQTFWLYADKPNEPRCSRCVTGDENYTSGAGSRRMLNLPTLGRSNNPPSFPLSGPATGVGVGGGSSKGGRARLVAPILPPTTRR